MTTVAFVFPGQAAQRPGMTSAWAGTASHDAFARVGAAVGRDLAALADDADACAAATAIAQPAILAASLAALQALRDAGVTPSLVAGHSLGEVTAAIAAGVLTEADGAALVAERGRAMGEACAAEPGGMAAVLRLEVDEVERLCQRAGGVTVANVNAPGQVVVSGSVAGVAALAAAAKAAGGRVLPLEVEGPFHSPAMAPAVVRVDALLRRTHVFAPAVPLVSGLDGRLRTSADGIVRSLVDGILAPVQWVQVQQRLRSERVDLVVEVGPGAILAGAARRTIPDVPTVGVARPEDVAGVLERLPAIDLTAAHALH